MTSNVFTFKEKTLNRHSIGFIVSQVRAVLNELRVQGMCVNQLPHDEGQLYTTEQTSKIIDQVVSDSVYYS